MLQQGLTEFEKTAILADSCLYPDLAEDPKVHQKAAIGSNIGANTEGQL